MARQQLSLHAAIAAVLVDSGPRHGPPVWMRFSQIAARIAECDLYCRPKDGAHPPAGQVAARVNQHTDLFERRENGLIEVRLRLSQR